MASDVYFEYKTDPKSKNRLKVQMDLPPKRYVLEHFEARIRNQGKKYFQKMLIRSHKKTCVEQCYSQYEISNHKKVKANG